MKIIKIFICLLFICQNLFSQCDLIRPKDDFETTSKVITQDQKIISVLALLNDKAQWDLFLKFAKIDSALRIIFTHECDYKNRGSGVVQSIFFKFKNDSLIKINNSIFTESVRSAGLLDPPGGTYYTSTAFLISKEYLQKFATWEIDKVRVKFASDFDYPEVDAVLKKKYSEKVMKNANCLFLDLK